MIQIVDFVMSKIVVLIVEFEKPTSITQKELLIAKKLWKLKFLNNAINPLLYSISIVNLFGSGGILEIMNGIFISNIWMTPLIGLLGDPMWFYKTW